MKWSPLSLAFYLLGAVAGHAQGTIQFMWNMQGGHVLTATTDYTVSGFGTLVLNHGVLSYDLTIPNLRNLPEQTHFHADATAMIISLAPYVYLPPSGGSPGELVFKGSLNVSSSLPELLAGEWYVQLHSPDYENGRMRGYITPVPEPSVATLAVAAVSGFVCFRWFKRQTARRNG